MKRDIEPDRAKDTNFFVVFCCVLKVRWNLGFKVDSNATMEKSLLAKLRLLQMWFYTATHTGCLNTQKNVVWDELKAMLNMGVIT